MKRTPDVLDIDRFLRAKPEELESLPWYEITARLGLLSFNSYGYGPVDHIASLAGIDESRAVLLVGCGSGGSAVHLAETTRATVHGIDRSPESIRAADALAERSTARRRLHFTIADAAALPFPPCSFDAVITEYVAFFLKREAFAGFHSVLKPGGHIGLAEMARDRCASAKAERRIAAAELAYSRIVGYAFRIPLAADLEFCLEASGFQDVRIVDRLAAPDLREKVRYAGGWTNVFRISRTALRLAVTSSVLREKFLAAGQAKRTFLQSRSTARYIFQAVILARKGRGR